MFETYILPALVLAITGGVFGVLIAVLSKVFHVKIDERVEKVIDMLPGYNCGACGSPGCAAFGEKVVSENADLKLCKPGKQEMRDSIRAYLDEQKNNS